MCGELKNSPIMTTPEIIPALLATSREEFETKVRRVESFASLAQIDILDGSWLPEQSWANPGDITNIISPLQYELHFMTTDVAKKLLAWEENPSVFRVLFQVETAADARKTIEAIRFYGWEAGAALNPETPIDAILPLIPYVDEIMFLAVHPGGSGRTFEPRVLEKIRAFLAMRHTLRGSIFPIIGIDGGVTRATLPSILSAGATRLRVNTALFESGVSAKEAWHTLNDII